MATNATYVEKGYGQVEGNRLSGITFGNIEAQAPAYEDAAATTPIDQLENGMVLCVIPDATAKTSPMGRIAVLPGAAPANAAVYLVYSERKVYDERKGYSDFVDLAADRADGLLFPKLVGFTPDSDAYTTNTLKADRATLKEGDVLYPGDDGYITTTQGTNTTICFVVDKVYTMPDGQKGVKLQTRRIDNDTI